METFASSPQGERPSESWTSWDKNEIWIYNDLHKLFNNSSLVGKNVPEWINTSIDIFLSKSDELLRSDHTTLALQCLDWARTLDQLSSKKTTEIRPDILEKFNKIVNSVTGQERNKAIDFLEKKGSLLMEQNHYTLSLLYSELAHRFSRVAVEINYTNLTEEVALKYLNETKWDLYTQFQKAKMILEGSPQLQEFIVNYYKQQAELFINKQDMQSMEKTLIYLKELELIGFKSKLKTE